MKPPTFTWKLMLTTLLLVLIISGFANSSLTIYEGAEFYGDKITLTFQSETTIRYLEVGENYFLLDELNTSISCSNPIAINVSAIDSGDNVSSGTTVLRFNATYSTSESVTFTFTGNHTAAIYNLYIDNTYSNIYEAGSFSFSYSSWSEHDFEIELEGYRPDPPYNGSSSYDTSLYTANFSWNRGNRSDRDVVVRNNASYPSSPTDGYEVYNGTNTYWNDTSVLSTRYYTVWSFNDTTGYYSVYPSLQLRWGALGIIVYNESSPWQQVSPFGLLISDQGGTDTYQNQTCTGTHYLDLLQIPYGVNTVFVINATEYVDRTYYKDLYANNFYNFTFYLPPIETPVDPGSGDPGGEGENYSTTQNYVITIIDQVNAPIPGAKAIIKRYINTTDSWNEVASGIADAYGQIPVSLIPGILYKVDLSADGFADSIGNDWMPTYIEFTDDRYKTFQLIRTIDEDDYYNFWEYITFTGTMNLNETIKILYNDISELTTDTQIYLYESFNGTNTLLNTTLYSLQEFTYYVPNINITRLHYADLYFNHSYNFEIDQPVRRYIFALNQSNDTGGGIHKTTQESIDYYFTQALGENPLGWGNTFAVILSLLILASLSPFHTGIAIIGAGAGLVVTELVFAFNNATLIILIPIIIAIGVFYILTKRPEEHL